MSLDTRLALCVHGERLVEAPLWVSWPKQSLGCHGRSTSTPCSKASYHAADQFSIGVAVCTRLCRSFPSKDHRHRQASEVYACTWADNVDLSSFSTDMHNL
eukprot:1230549-Amphidinium_carterae.1